MLQHRLPLRTVQHSCRCLQAARCRTYATETQTQAPAEAPREADGPATTKTPQKFELPSAPPPLQKKTVDIRTYTPRTPGVRHLRRPIADHLWKGRPVKRLTFPKKGHAKGGRNSTGSITVRHRGGGHKRRIRTVDFERKAPGPHIVERIEYDPGRTAHIALVRPKAGGQSSYILAPEGMRAGEVIESYRSGIPQHLLDSMGGSLDLGVLASKTAWRGNCMPLTMVPVGTLIFNIGLKKGKGGQLCRGAGTYGILLAKAGEVPAELPELKVEEGTEAVASSGENNTQDATANSSESNVNSSTENRGDVAQSETTATRSIEQSEPTTNEHGEPEKPAESSISEQEHKRLKKLSEHVTIRLSSGEVRLIHKECCATIGVASNSDHRYAQLGKAGRSRWKNIRPTVRGLAMNAMDHPHGGGRGKSKGNVPSKSPWGLPAKGGYKTRKKSNINHDVVIPRPRKQGKRQRKGYN